MEKYERICPGSADRILKMAERQAKHRRNIEAIAITAFILSGVCFCLGQISAGGIFRLNSCVSYRCIHIADETESQHPAPESVFFIFSLLWNGACVLEVFSKLAHSEAKLNVSLELSAMNPAFFPGVRLIELEEAKFDSAFRE